eukprot:TRINITY_DN7679_c0_g1_i2.p1 TRINITY_DN7679_c0_g1~~TRINITY_DN7679_c0_g1_i2.p1  ORF type:complete len:163 (-),score=10.24 TRINITY_DN7679_c0_g1_i2:164-652(-)
MIREVKKQFDKGIIIDFDASKEQCDVHVVSALLKQYLRELPEPLITYVYYDDFITAWKTKDKEVIKSLVEKLPVCQRKCLKLLLGFLHLVHKSSKINMMDAQNLAIIFSPSLLRTRKGDVDTVIQVDSFAFDITFSQLLCRTVSQRMVLYKPWWKTMINCSI